jgi:hypothetical protein
MSRPLPWRKAEGAGRVTRRDMCHDAVACSFIPRPGIIPSEKQI